MGIRGSDLAPRILVCCGFGMDPRLHANAKVTQRDAIRPDKARCPC